MNHLRTKILGLMIAGVGVGVGATALQGCDAADELCGPCGSISTGQYTIAGDAQFDGFFTAVGNFNAATGKIKADFDADIRALAQVWGYGEANATIDAAFVDGLVGHIKGEISANVEGGLQIVYTPPKCEANVSVAVEAQAQCEASAECDVQVDPGEVAVSCEGSCSGSCSAECSGSLSCAVKAPTVACEGECEGTCQLDAAASCEGTCRGDCSGECSATDANGKCAGTCSGMCTGSCELAARASCGGTCHGTCYVDQGSAQCTAEAECAGSCSGECKGSCEGNFKPPSASADCDASAECNAQASAQGSASLECTPPSLDISYKFAASLDADGQAAFSAKLLELRVRGVAILQGAAKLGALITGKVNGEVVFDPAPLVAIGGQIDVLVNADFSALPKGRFACIVPALKEASQILGQAAGKFAGTIEAQASFAAVFDLN